MSRLATLLAITGLALALLVACGGDSEPSPTSVQSPAQTPTSATVAPVATQTPAPTLAATPAPEPVATPTQTPASLAGSASLWPGGIDIDGDTAWQEVFDVLTASEQECIRGTLGDELAGILAHSVASEDSPDESSPDWAVQFFSCLEAETARSVLLSMVVGSLFEPLGLSSEELDVSCMREAIAEVDVAALVASPEGSPESDELFGRLFSCAPTLLVSHFGLNPGELNEEEASCIRESMSDVDVAAALEGLSRSDELSARLFACVPTLMVVSFGINRGELSEEEISCLRELDVAAWLAAAEDSPESDVFLSGMISCVSGFSAVAETPLSLDEYEAWCSEHSQVNELAADEDISSTELADTIAAAKAVSPPAELLEYHSRIIFLLRAHKGLLDWESDDDSIFFILFFHAALVQEAEDNLPSDVRARLVKAGCIESRWFEEPETSLGTFAVGETVRVGGYDVQVESPRRPFEPDKLWVSAVIINATDMPLALPKCTRNMSIQDEEGSSLEQTGCSWSGDYDADEIPPGGRVLITLVANVPEDAAGLIWRFSADTVGVEFGLEPATVPTPVTLATPIPDVSPDRAVLEAFYNATNGSNWSDNRNWLDTQLVGWYGVGRDYLHLSDNQLVGEIPPDLGNLSNLVNLILWGNQLSGEIPPELGKLSNLEGLYLSQNQLSGEIPPELGKLFNLVDLQLYSNQLSGEIPPDLGSLSNLVELYINGNQLSGEIPPELGKLSNLEELYLSFNQLSGEIPPELGRLSNLEGLYLSHNQLSGEIPQELGKLTNLEVLYLWGNQLSGCIPNELRDVPTSDLDQLDLQFCD